MRTIRKLVASIAFIVIAAVAVMFALANRGEVPVSLWPLPFSISLRLSVAVLGALAIGIVLGGLISWTSGASRRLRHRSHASEKTPSPAAAAPTPRDGDRPRTGEPNRLPALADRD